MFRTVLLWTCLVATSSLLVSPLPAAASLPGRDGAIAFDSDYEQGEDCPFGDDSAVFEPCVYSIFRVQPSGRSQRRLSACGTEANPQCSDSGVAWSPDGRWIVFTQYGELSLMRSDGSHQRSLGVSGAGAAWSPDGKRIAFSQFGDVTVMNADGSDVRVLPDGGVSGSVAWSSRNRLAFVRAIPSGSREVVTMTPDGADTRVAVPACRCSSLDFSPRGNRIVYTVGFKSTALFTVTSRGEDRHRLVGSAVDPAWSPSGRYIAFTRGTEIFVAHSDGTAAHRVRYDVKRRLGNDIAGDYSNPAWQPLPR
jgi:Tol biopolymer transport system component